MKKKLEHEPLSIKTPGRLRYKGGRRKIDVALKKEKRLSLHLSEKDNNIFAEAYKERKRKGAISQNTFAIECILKSIGLKENTGQIRRVKNPTLANDKPLYEALLRQLDDHNTQLRRLGVNLNQLQKIANAPKLTVKSGTELRKQIDELLPELAMLIKNGLHTFNEFQENKKGAEVS